MNDITICLMHTLNVFKMFWCLTRFLTVNTSYICIKMYIMSVLKIFCIGRGLYYLNAVNSFFITGLSIHLVNQLSSELCSFRAKQFPRHTAFELYSIRHIHLLNFCSRNYLSQKVFITSLYIVYSSDIGTFHCIRNYFNLYMSTA